MPSKAPFGFNVMGCATGNFGESVVLRNTIRVLLGRGYPVAIRNFETGDGRSGKVHTYDDLFVSSSRSQPYSINLFGFNPPTLAALMQRLWLAVPFERRINVMLPAWELDVLPPAWADGFRMMDVVLTSSEFVAQTVRQAVPEVPVMRVYTAVYPPEDIVPDRARWGLAEGEVVFFSAFDVTSDVERKNPWAAIEAFRLAFPLESADEQAPCVRLLIKLSHARVDPAYAEHVARLEQLAAADPRITLLEEEMSYRDALTLYASSDVFVSLHRAEGLGLVLMEAMSLGKPIIATAYSGSMDFTTAENAALVDFTLVPVEGLHHEYQVEQTGGGAHWAEPSVPSAAEWMKRLAADAELRARIGEQAARDMDARRARHLSGEGFEELRAFAETYDLHGEAHRRAAGRLRAARVRFAMQLPMKALRRLGRMVRGVLHR